MADDCLRTPGSGESIAADELGTGVKVQYVKLMDGTVDGTDKAHVDATNGLKVDVSNASIAGTAGSANSGVLSVQGIASMTPVQAQLVAGTASIGKLAANDGVDIGNVDVASLPARAVTNEIQWSHYSNEYTTTQTSVDMVALSGTTKFYIGRLTIGTGGTTAGLVTVYFGTSTYSAGTSKTVFRGSFAPAATVYPGVVIGNGAAPFIISGAGDALRITTSAGITVYVQVDYIRV